MATCCICGKTCHTTIEKHIDCVSNVTVFGLCYEHEDFLSRCLDGMKTLYEARSDYEKSKVVE